MENNARIITNIQNTLKMVREQLDAENAVPKKVKYTSLLVDDIGQRLDVGAEKYGMQVPIEDSDGRIFTQEAYEELCDAIVYLSSIGLNLISKAKDDDDGFDDDGHGDDDDYVEEILEHEALFNGIVEHLYAAYKAGTSPSYLETFAEHGWGFAGIEDVANEWGLLDQVRTIAYPEKFTCTILDPETERPKIKLTEDDKEDEKRCHVRLMPLLDVIDNVVVLPNMMFRYKESIMNRFNQLHSAVKKKLDEDERKEALRKAKEARDKAKQQQQQKEAAQATGNASARNII